nr:MAG TPA: hypothetical protein [Caudoviricetes sp.]
MRFSSSPPFLLSNVLTSFLWFYYSILLIVCQVFYGNIFEKF